MDAPKLFVYPNHRVATVESATLNATGSVGEALREMAEILRIVSPRQLQELVDVREDEGSHAFVKRVNSSALGMKLLMLDDEDLVELAVGVALLESAATELVRVLGQYSLFTRGVDLVNLEDAEEVCLFVDDNQNQSARPAGFEAGSPPPLVDFPAKVGSLQ